VEEEQIDGEQRSKQAGLEHEDKEAELTRAFLNIPASGIKDRKRDQNGGEEDEKEANSVHAEMIRNPEVRDPFILLDELVARLMRIELRKEIETERKWNQRKDKCRIPNRPLLVLHQDDQRPEQREKDQSSQQSAAHQCVTR